MRKEYLKKATGLRKKSLSIESTDTFKEPVIVPQIKRGLRITKDKRREVIAEGSEREKMWMTSMILQFPTWGYLSYKTFTASQKCI